METLENAKALLLREDTIPFSGLLRKYASYGFCFHETAYNEEFRYKHARWVEDCHSFVLPLPKFPSYSENRAFVDPIRVTSWWILKSPSNKHHVHFYRAIYSENGSNYPLVVCSARMVGMIREFATSGIVGMRAVRSLLSEDIDIS